jgi:glycosyltransferase involved in cell wall biosynthesis
VTSLLAADHTNEYVLFFDSRMKDVGPFRRENTTVRFFPFSQYRRFLPFAYSHLLISATLNRERLDLFHAPANIIPLGYTKPAIVTIHDLAIFHNPSWFPTQVFSTRLLVPQTLKRARAILAVSENTAKDLRELFRVPEERISVIHEGVDLQAVATTEVVSPQERFGLPEKYFCFVGTLEPRKNLIRLVEAYADLRKRNAALENIPLILAGKKGWKSEAIFKTISANGLEASVRYLGYISGAEKIGLIRGAQAFVFPSSYEGFGLPVLEALALGTPVLTSNQSSLPEVTGDAAELIDPESTEAIAKGIERVLFDEPLRKRLRTQGIEQARKFSWEKVALQTIALYEKIGATLHE